MHNKNHLSFDVTNHIYRWNGNIVPSVTQILNNVGVKKNDKWYSISGGEFVNDDTAARYGTEFHKIASFVSQGIDCTYDPVFAPDVQSLKLFFEKYPIITRFVEAKFYSPLYRYAGTLDLYGEYKGHNILIDWKTATSFHEVWRSQTAAYAFLVRENRGTETTSRNPHRWTVRFKQDGKMPEIDQRRNHPQDWNRFLSILNVYKTYIK